MAERTKKRERKSAQQRKQEKIRWKKGKKRRMKVTLHKTNIYLQIQLEADAWEQPIEVRVR